MKDKLQDHIERIKRLRPIDDTLFEVLADDDNFCQEILQVILDRSDLVVKEVVTQKTIRKLLTRSVRLDALCEFSDGTYANVEIQRADNTNHLKRIRYNEACVTTNITEPGINFENIPNVITVFISEFDLFRANKTVYHINKIVEETGKQISDGTMVVCVNTEVSDGSKISRLMKLFQQTEVDTPEFPAFTKRMHDIKHTEGGQENMCEIIEEYARELAEEYAKELADNRMIKFMLSKNCSKEEILETLSEQNHISLEDASKILEEYQDN